MKHNCIASALAAFLLFSSLAFAGERVAVWPKGKMPHRQQHQIAAMTDEAAQKGFKADKHRTAYIEWYDAPKADVRNGACMILISGGGYNSCCDVKLVAGWAEKLTALGFQCVNFVYRTPRPTGLPIWQTAWEDGQRAVRMVRKDAEKRALTRRKSEQSQCRRVHTSRCFLEHPHRQRLMSRWMRWTAFLAT